MKNEIYSVAYNDKNDNGFSKIEPWIISDFGNDLKKCKIKANELIKQWCKMLQFLNVMNFQKL